MTGNFLLRIQGSVYRESCLCAYLKTYRGVVAQLCSSLTSPIDGLIWTDLLAGRSIPWKGYASTYCPKSFWNYLSSSKTINITISITNFALDQILADMCCLIFWNSTKGKIPGKPN